MVLIFFFFGGGGGGGGVLDIWIEFGGCELPLGIQLWTGFLSCKKTYIQNMASCV